MVLMHSSAMATGCIVLDSDDDDGPCSATARSQTSGAVAFVDLCSDADENDAHHEPREDQMMTSTEAPPRTSEHSGGSSMSVGEVRLGSLWDSEEEELPPLSARLQLRQEPPQQSTRPQKRSSVHKISDSEDEDEFPDVGHVIGVVCSATSSLMSLDMPPPPACDADIPGSAAFTLLKKPKRARLSPEEREARRVAKEQEKQRKACVTEMGRATKPGHCMKYMTVVLDSRLLDDEASLQVICDTLGQGDICAQVQMLPVERAVCWKRTALSLTQDLISREQVEERDVLVVLPWDQFLHLVSSQRQDPSKRTRSSLSEYMMSVGGVYPEKNLTYVVYSLEKYFNCFYRKEKSRTNAEYRALVLGSQPVVRRDRPGVYDGAPLTRRDIQETLVPLQLDSGVTITTKEDPQELAEYLAKLTRALAERPHREAKQSRPLQHLTAGCLSKHDSLRRTWQAQLEQFAGVSRDVAEAIVGQYPAPRLLLQAYQACRDRALGETLLADIQVRRGAGALQSTRRVGPVISGRIYRFFVATDQDAYFD
ncbi:methyl methanesulfonate sensitivity 4 isoform X3 [Amblyomma americanum]